MTFLDFFALLVLFILATVLLAGAVALGLWPGRIAKQRNHPQADAINVCSWLGILSLGLLWPIAMIWAHTRSCATDAAGNSDLQNEMNHLRDRVAQLETAS